MNLRRSGYRATMDHIAIDSVGIDGYNLAMARGTGIATYGVALAETVRASGCRVDGVFGLKMPSDPSLREVALFDAVKRPADPLRRTNRYQRAWYFARSFRRPQPREVPISTNVEKSSLAGDLPTFDRLVSVGHLFEGAFTYFKSTGRFVRLKIDRPPAVMHWTYPVPIAMAGVPNVYTLHDLVPLKLPYTTLDNKELYGRIVAGCIDHAAQLCTVSESSKVDIVERYGIAPERVINTYQVSSLPVAALVGDGAADVAAIEGVFGLTRRGYFLYYGAIEPKKNVGRLIEAYLSSHSDTPLVIVGARAWQSEQELRLMPEGGAGGAPGIYRGHRGQTIIRLDYLPRPLLAKLIRGAKAVVFPSLYEGFGLPVLEAMQLGTPVITSTTSSLPEVAGEAGLLVDPYDVGALQAAMKRVDDEPELCRAMSARGLEQAKVFSRERYQERLTELYRAAMSPR